jgi:hypothetical protein
MIATKQERQMANYDTINLAEMAEESDRLDAQGNTDFLENFVRMPEKAGVVTIRLLPPAKGRKFFCATRTHRINNRSIHCPRVLVNRNGQKRWEDEDHKNPCVICKYYNELWKESEKKEGKAAEELQNQARKIKPIERYYYNCIVRTQVNKNGETEKNVGPKILSIGKTLHQRIVRAIVGDKANDEKPLGDVSDIKNGRDFKIIKKMKGTGPNAYPQYDDSKFLDPSPLGEKDQVEKWLDSLHDLSALRVLKTTEEMKIELKKHQDEATSSDITEFQKNPEASLEDQVRHESQRQQSTPAAAEKPKPANNTPAPADAALAEADFLEELKNM